MIKNLVSFGCSWPHGEELDDRNDAYPALIAKHNSWTLEDRTRLQTTLPEMLADFNDWVTAASKEARAESLVLINLTREDLSGPLANLPSEVTHKILIDKNSNVGDQVFEWAVAAFNNTALLEQVPMVQFNVLSRQHKLKFRTLIESSSALEMLVIRDKPRKDPLFTEHKFPNEKGHAILSEFLIKKIDSVILDE